MDRRRSASVRGLPKSRDTSRSSFRMEELPAEALQRQNQELRRRLDEESNNYRRRLDTYRQAQRHQATLVSRLQAKVLQYKKRCAELESSIDEGAVSRSPSHNVYTGPGSALDVAQKHLRERDERIHDLDTALRRLNEAQAKCEKLVTVNEALRDQLREAHESNEALTNDLQKLTMDWEQMREDVISKEEDWKEEEQYFNDYYSTEHNRLLHLWRDVVALKRQFSEVQTSTERDLNKMKGEISSSAREMMTTANGISSRASLTSVVGEKQYQQAVMECAELRAHMQTLQAEHEATLNQVRFKEDKIQQLNRDLHNLEEKCSHAVSGVAQASRLQEEADLLQNALRDIAHAVIQDSEGRDTDPQPTPHVHLTPSQAVPPRSPKRGAPRTSPAFAESTISAVQAALHKYQLLIHELQVKLQTSKDQLLTARRHNESCDEATHNLEARIAELTEQLDAMRLQTTHLAAEKDMLTKSLDSARAEKNALDKNRVEINTMLETLSGDYEKVQKANSRLQKMVETIEDEKMFLQNEVDRLNKDAELREISLRTEEDRCSRLREELLTVREDLNKAQLGKDMLEQHKAEAEALLCQVEKSRGEVELELERVLLERSDVHDSMAKAESATAALENDKKRLMDDVRRLEQEKAALQSQVVDQNNDLGSLRKELLQAEQTWLDLDSEKISLHEKLKFLEIEKEKVESELAQVTRERGDLSNQLSILARKKEGLNEELVRIRQRLEQANETNSRINRNLEDLVKDCEEKQVMLESNDKELQRLQEQLASLRTEKEALEGVLFDSQTNLEATDNRRVQLEKEQQELLVKQESLKGQICRLNKELENSEKLAREIKATLTQQAAVMEADYQQTIANLRKHTEDAVRKLTDEKEQIRISLEKRHQVAVSQLSAEKDMETHQLQERLSGLEQHIENICQQHEEALVRAENDKQQALLLAHHDQQALLEKLNLLKREWDEERSASDRVRREAAAKVEQDRASINTLRDELARVKARMDEARIKTEEEKGRLENKIEETRKERDSAVQECEELKVQLHLSEDRFDHLQAQLHETQRRVKEAENSGECLRKELMDVRRQLGDATFEKEKYNTSNKELRETIKRSEGEKREQARTLEEAFQKISSLEDTRTSLEVERARLQTLNREVEKQMCQSGQASQGLQEEINRVTLSLTQAQAELKELQIRLSTEVEERERSQHECHQMRKQVVELDGGLEAARQEIHRLRTRGDEEEDRWRNREQELLVRLEDGRTKERKLEDQRHNLEVCLADATQQIHELKARLGGAEGRVRALDSQLMQLEGAKKEVEQKLSSVGSTLRRIAGIQLDGSVSLPFKLTSPSRRFSPVRSHTQDQHTESARGDAVIDVDPEVVRKGVRNLMHTVAQMERERDDLKTVVASQKKQLQDAQEQQGKVEGKMASAMNTLRQFQEEKGSLEAKLGQKNAALQIQSEALQQKTEEIQKLRERMTSLELTALSGSEEKTQCEEKLEKMRQTLNRAEAEKRGLQEEMGRTEGRATKLELQRMSLDGDLQRLQMVLQEKDSTLKRINEKGESQACSITALEERCASLKSTVDQLNMSLERASDTETELREEIQSLQRTLMDTSQTSQSSTEKLKQLQKSLTNSENERRVMAERLESVQQALQELRRAQQQLTDTHARTCQELSNCEVQRAGLESQLRLANWPSESGTSDEVTRLQKERSDMRIKLEAMHDKLRHLENEKRSLERKMLSRSKSYERPEKASHETLCSGRDSNQLESENRELRHKVRRLESQLEEKEAELARLNTDHSSRTTLDRSGDLEKYRAGQLQAERLLDAREQSHRQQVQRLESQIQMLREQVNQEVKRRQMYVLRSSRVGREAQQLRQVLGDSLSRVSQDPSLDAGLLEHETRKLDTSVTPLALPPPRPHTPHTPHN